MSQLRVEYVDVATLKPWPANSRTHSKKQLRQLKNAIQRFGFNSVVVIDHENLILAGHARVEAAKLLGLKEVPCIRIETMSAIEKRAYVIADNKLAINAGWDEEVLATELQALATEVDFDIDLTGFSLTEVDHLVDELACEEPGDPKDNDLPPDGPARCQPGDLWKLGPHRLICGNALDRDVTGALMGSDVAKLVFTDPPYNVPIQGHAGGKGRIKHREFAMASGEMTATEFTAFLRAIFENLVRHSCEGSIHYVCMDWRHIDEILVASRGIYTELKNLIVWVKDNGGMGSFYRSRHELIFAFKNGAAAHVNNFELGQQGRYRTNVWQYKGVNTFRKGRLDELELHPTAKPVQMLADAMKDTSGRGDIVLDLFGGSGSTLIAAHKTGRRAYLCEIDPVYCDRIIRRWEVYARDDAEKIVPRRRITAR